MSSFLMNLNLNTPKQQQRLERLKREKKERESFEEYNTKISFIHMRNNFLTKQQMIKKSAEMVKRLHLNMSDNDHFEWEAEYWDLRSRIKQDTRNEIKTYILKEDEILCGCGVIVKKSEADSKMCLKCSGKFWSGYDGTRD